MQKKEKGKVRNRMTWKKDVKVSLFTDDMTVDLIPRGSREAEREREGHKSRTEAQGRQARSATSNL